MQTTIWMLMHTLLGFKIRIWSYDLSQKKCSSEASLIVLLNSVYPRLFKYSFRVLWNARLKSPVHSGRLRRLHCSLAFASWISSWRLHTLRLRFSLWPWKAIPSLGLLYNASRELWSISPRSSSPPSFSSLHSLPPWARRILFTSFVFGSSPKLKIVTRRLSLFYFSPEQSLLVLGIGHPSIYLVYTRASQLSLLEYLSASQLSNEVFGSSRVSATPMGWVRLRSSSIIYYSVNLFWNLV